MSVDLQWELVRKHNAGLVKRSGYTFATEAGNLTNKHALKFSGYAQAKNVKIVATENGVAVSHRASRRPSNKVATAYTKTSNFKTLSGARRACKAVEAELVGSFYRPDLVTAAKARIVAIMKSQKVKKIQPKKLRANKLAKLTKN